MRHTSDSALSRQIDRFLGRKARDFPELGLLERRERQDRDANERYVSAN